MVQGRGSVGEDMEKGFLSGAVLKNTAYITMFTDHFFAIVYRSIIRRCQTAGYAVGDMERIYAVGRAVGRISFILFAYLAVEGFLHTRSRGAYLFRLGAFALLSEIPFDLAFSGSCYDPGSQNVFFTLFLGVLALAIWEWAADRKGVLWGIAACGALACCCGAAYIGNTDYRYMGVLLIYVLYQTREGKLPVQMLAAGCVMLFGTWSANWFRYAGDYSASYLFRFSLREMYGLAAFVLIALYSGEKGHQLPKAFYYAFYPVHLMALYCAAIYL